MNMNMKIEKNIPIPPKRIGANAYPLKSMDIGDSFHVPVVKSEVAKVRAGLIASVRYCKLQTAMNFVCRSVDGGLRVWRTE